MTQEKIDSIRERMCDEYCRFPRLVGIKYTMNVLCKDCPLDELEASE